MKPLIIFEGPDCAGKSTLVRKFFEAHSGSCNVIHHGPYTGMTDGDLLRLYDTSMAATCHELTLMDRCWVSEPIYGKVHRNGESRIDRIGRDILISAARKRQAVVVLCLPEWGVLADSWVSRQDEEYLERVEHLRQVYDLYRWLTPSEIGLPYVAYDWTKDATGDLIASIRSLRETTY